MHRSIHCLLVPLGRETSRALCVYHARAYVKPRRSNGALVTLRRVGRHFYRH